jgi:hypothetical protein
MEGRLCVRKSIQGRQECLPHRITADESVWFGEEAVTPARSRAVANSARFSRNTGRGSESSQASRAAAKMGVS